MVLSRSQVLGPQVADQFQMLAPTDFEAYVNSSRAWLHREAYRLCGDWHEAEDLVQAAFQKIHHQWDRLAQQQNLAGYTRRVLRNTYISERRRFRWAREVIQADVPDLAAVPGAIPVEDRIVLLAAVNRLGPRQRLIIVLRFWSDISAERTATILQCSVGNITSQTNRALNRLRVLLADREL